MHAIKSLLTRGSQTTGALPRSLSDDYKTFSKHQNSKKTKETEKEIPKVQRLSYDPSLPTASLGGRVKSWNGESEEAFAVIFEDTKNTPKVKKKKADKASDLGQGLSIDEKLALMRRAEFSPPNKKKLDREEKLRRDLQAFDSEKQLTKNQCKRIKRHFDQFEQTTEEKEDILMKLERLSSIEQGEVSPQLNRKSVDKKLLAARHKFESEPEELTKKECELLMNSAEKLSLTPDETNKLKEILVGLSSPRLSRKVSPDEIKLDKVIDKFNLRQELTKKECDLLITYMNRKWHPTSEERERVFNLKDEVLFSEHKKKFEAAVDKFRNEKKNTTEERELLIKYIDRWNPTQEERERVSNIQEHASPKPSKKALAEEKELRHAMDKFNYNKNNLTKNECALLMENIDKFCPTPEERKEFLKTLNRRFWRGSV